MGRVRYDDPPALLILAAVGEVRVHEHEARQLPLRAGGGLERHGVEAADLGQDLLQTPHELERALCPILVLQRMEIDEPGEPRRDLVHARVVLHRAGAERIEAGVHSEVPRRQGREVANELGLRDLGQPGRLLAAQ